MSDDRMRELERRVREAERKTRLAEEKVVVTRIDLVQENRDNVEKHQEERRKLKKAIIDLQFDNREHIKANRRLEDKIKHFAPDLQDDLERRGKVMQAQDREIQDLKLQIRLQQSDIPRMEVSEPRWYEKRRELMRKHQAKTDVMDKANQTLIEGVRLLLKEVEGLEQTVQDLKKKAELADALISHNEHAMEKSIQAQEALRKEMHDAMARERKLEDEVDTAIEDKDRLEKMMEKLEIHKARGERRGSEERVGREVAQPQDSAGSE